MRLALFQPEIAQNVGAAIRAAACFGAGVDLIRPFAFPLTAKDIKRVAMDYRLLAEPLVHDSWEAFKSEAKAEDRRLILLTTKADQDLWDVSFKNNDIVITGQESAGAPDFVHASVDVRARIAIAPEARSLNLAIAASVALSEARRQIGWPVSSSVKQAQ